MSDLATSKTNILTERVKLNAQNSELLAAYYQDAIGLTLLNEEDNHYTLGTPDGHALLDIVPATTMENPETTGLYHIALLLPEYKDLGTFLRHLIVKQVPMTGASDHGYSNALYLNDPEGNGIEIYWDKPESEWDIQPDGTIVGIVEPMDAESALEVADTTFNGVPNGTTMGHVHLHIDDMAAGNDFYTNVMGLGLKLQFGPQAAFLAGGTYHHHLGANLWKPGQLAQPTSGQPGLENVTWTASAEDFHYIETKLTETDHAFEKSDDTLIFKDPAGIQHLVVAK